MDLTDSYLKKAAQRGIHFSQKEEDGPRHMVDRQKLFKGQSGDIHGKPREFRKKSQRKQSKNSGFRPNCRRPRTPEEEAAFLL